jgi:hypothetical protein
MTTQYLHTDLEGDTAKVLKSFTTLDAAFIHTPNRAALVTKDEAPALALALLELSGWESDHNGGPMAHALSNLAKHLKNEEARKAEEEARKAAEAADAAALEEEAVALANVFRAGLRQGAARTSLAEMPNPKARETWLKIAKAARELHAAPAPVDASPCCVTFDCE